MNASEMHYDFKQKLNSIDSQKYRGLKVPEIDWKLNEAQEVFIRSIAEPRFKSQLGFEVNQRSIDDIRSIVVNQNFATGIVPVSFDSSSFIVTLPVDYWFKVSSEIYATKGNCINKKLKARSIQHDDEAELSSFDKSSFEWRVSNYRFYQGGIRVFTDESFTITRFVLGYIRHPRRIQNAQDYVGGTYTALDGTVLTGTQSCELPIGVHSEIVDLAVLITAGDLSLPDYQLKYNKRAITN